MRPVITLIATCATVIHLAFGCCLHAAHLDGGCCRAGHADGLGEACCDGHGDDEHDACPPDHGQPRHEPGGVITATDVGHACDGCFCAASLVEVQPLPDAPAPLPRIRSVIDAAVDATRREPQWLTGGPPPAAVRASLYERFQV